MKRFIVLFALCLVLTWAVTATADPSAPGASQERLEASGLSWASGKTPLSKLSVEQKKAMLGWRPNPTINDLPRFKSKLSMADVPHHLDWREYGGDFITPIRDQSDCGSCYAFSGVGAIEAAWAIKMGLNDPQLNLSEQYIVSCQSIFGCDGGWMTDVLVAARDAGIPDEDCFTYGARDYECNRKCEDWARRTLMLEDFEVVLNEEADTPEEYEAIVMALQEGPVTVGFDVYENFFEYEHGVYGYTSGMLLGGHGVVIIGYDIDAQYWICKNSWGSSFGESGMFRIEWGISGFGREVMLPITPPCTQNDLYLHPVDPGVDFIRYEQGPLPVALRVTDDCGRGAQYAEVTARYNGQSFMLFDDGAHNDGIAGDGIFWGAVPAAMVTLGPVEIAIEATSPGMTGASMTVYGEVKKPAEVLLIADEGEEDGYLFYGRMLDDIGVDYDLWRVVDQKRFPRDLLAQAHAVIWFTGPALGTFFDAEEVALAAFLDRGGKLMMVGQDLMQNLHDRYYRFARDYLKVKTYFNDTGSKAAGGVPGEPLTEGIACPLTYPFTDYSDTIKVMEGATPIWRNEDLRNMGLRFPMHDAADEPYRFAFAAFPLQAMPMFEAKKFTARVMDWFFGDVCLDTDGDGFGYGGSCTDPYQDCENDDAEVFPGAEEICDDGKDNDCNGLVDLDDPACEDFLDDDTTGDDDTAPVDDDDDDDNDDDQVAGDDDDDGDDSGCGL